MKVAAGPRAKRTAATASRTHDDMVSGRSVSITLRNVMAPPAASTPSSSERWVPPMPCLARARRQVETRGQSSRVTSSASRAARASAVPAIGPAVAPADDDADGGAWTSMRASMRPSSRPGPASTHSPAAKRPIRPADRNSARSGAAGAGSARRCRAMRAARGRGASAPARSAARCRSTPKNRCPARPR